METIEKAFKTKIEIQGKLTVKKVGAVYCYQVVTQRNTAAQTVEQGLSAKMPTIKGGRVFSVGLYSLRYKEKDIGNNKKLKQFGTLALVNANWFDKLRFHCQGTENGFYAIWKKVYKNPFDHIEEEGCEVVVLDNSSHMVFNLDCEPVYWQFFCDYIHAGFSSYRYNLEKVLPVLQKNKDVQLTSGIEKVPYYNNESGNQRCISFMYSPGREDLKKIWKECLKMGGGFPSTNRDEAVYNLDLLSVKKFHYGKSFYDQVSDND